MSAVSLIFDPALKGRGLIAGHLQNTGLFERQLLADSPARALALLEKEEVDLVFIGWRGDTVEEGSRLLQSMRKRVSWSDIPVSAFGWGDPDLRLAALEEGLFDVFDIHSTSRELGARLRPLLRQKQRIDALRRDKEHLAKLALIDALTGLYNRPYFEASLEIEIARALRLDQPCVLLLLDMDHFKAINDTYGHRTGDSVLQAVATALRQGLRRGDILARFGGEEFAAILPGTSTPDAFALAERLRGTIAHLSTGALKKLPLSISIGITSLAQRPQVHPAQLLEEADCALYRSKRKGRNRTEIYQGEGRSNITEIPSFTDLPYGMA